MPVVQEGRSAPPVWMIKLTAAREITPYRLRVFALLWAQL